MAAATLRQLVMFAAIFSPSVSPAKISHSSNISPGSSSSQPTLCDRSQSAATCSSGPCASVTNVSTTLGNVTPNVICITVFLSYCHPVSPFPFLNFHYVYKQYLCLTIDYFPDVILCLIAVINSISNDEYLRCSLHCVQAWLVSTTGQVTCVGWRRR